MKNSEQKVPYLEYLDHNHLIWTGQVDLVLGADEACNFFNHRIGLESGMIPNVVSDGVL